MRKLLFVDDSQILLQLYKAEFEREGYQVDISGSITDALTLVNRNDYDLLILEVQMPDMDGLESLRRFLCRNKNLPIIINSGFECYKDCAHFPVCPADSFILKSSDLSALKREVRSLMAETGNLVAE